MRKHAESNPFMTKPSWYGRLCQKLRTPRIPPMLNPTGNLLGITMLLMCIIALSQGVDYVVRPFESTASLSIVEAALNLDYWGIIFLVFGTLALVGPLFAIWPAAIIGHGVLAFNYLAIGVGVFWSLFEKTQLWGWNTGVIYICFAIFHGLVADSCYDQWAREWKHAPPSVHLVEGDSGHADV